MCIAYLAYRSHPDWPWFIAANRDEFHQRPTRAAAPWPDHPDIIAGIDLQAGGTWLGLSVRGRFALLTNYRNMAETPKTSTRGRLVSDFLLGNNSAVEYMQQVAGQAADYAGFNLIVGDPEAAVYFSNRSSKGPQELVPGRYVLSNHLLDTPWPKSRRLRDGLEHFPSDSLLQSTDQVFAILKDQQVAPDGELPETGLDIERERLLSSPFIVSPDYGTRCSTLIAVNSKGQGLFDELTYLPSGEASVRHSWPFVLDAGCSQTI